jgi:hypothetical protein
MNLAGGGWGAETLGKADDRGVVARRIPEGPLADTSVYAP